MSEAMEATPRVWRNPLFLAGTGIALAAGTVAQRGWTQADETWKLFESDSPSDEVGVSGLSNYNEYEQTWQDFQAYSRQYRLGGAAAIAGVALAGTGLFLGSADSVDASVWAATGEVGARLVWSR